MLCTNFLPLCLLREAPDSTECDPDKSHTTLQWAEGQLRGDFTWKQVNTNCFPAVLVSFGTGSW